MQSRRTLTLTLSLLQGERGTFGGTVSGSPNRAPRRVRSSSPLPARSGERIKVRGASDCMVTTNYAASISVFALRVSIERGGRFRLKDLTECASDCYANLRASNNSTLTGHGKQ